MNRSEVNKELQKSPWKTDESSIGCPTELKSPGVPDALAETRKTQATNKSNRSNTSACWASKRRSLNAYGAITYHEKVSLDQISSRPRNIARQGNQSALTQE